MSLSEDLSNSTLGGNFSSNDSTPGNFRIQCRATSIVPVIIFVLTVLLGVPGNGAVTWVMGFKVKRSVHTVCFLNLAVADLTYCRLPPLPGGLLPAKFLPQKLLPLDQHLSLAWVRAVCFGAWGLAFLMCLPELLMEQIYPYFGDKTRGVLELTWAVFVFGLPIVLMAACYLLIGRKLHGDKLAKSRKPVRLMVTKTHSLYHLLAPLHCLPPCQGRLQTRSLGLDILHHQPGLLQQPLLYVFIGRNFRQVFRRSLAASLRLAFAEDTELENIRPNPIVSAETST
ncbi:C3a anaphylatoxin chemotactic receptor-like [Pristis pectinata]|uniref:C3a anaphylatoxin chemotactic receptor-like n=1 Tax=Pristis pectinata TaxID=685728 RepID=UPI00223CA349|nr:C3a anaphylatoxin chemotactic receptor-like [Pristis pectinata]